MDDFEHPTVKRCRRAYANAEDPKLPGETDDEWTARFLRERQGESGPANTRKEALRRVRKERNEDI